jgi:hypothetical protein
MGAAVEDDGRVVYFYLQVVPESETAESPDDDVRTKL